MKPASRGLRSVEPVFLPPLDGLANRLLDQLAEQDARRGRVEVLADDGFHERVADDDWHDVIARMTPRLREARPFHALQEGLTAIESLLEQKGFRRASGSRTDNELPDRPIEERGA